MILGVFYIVPSDPLAGVTVTAKMVDRMKHFLYIQSYLRRHQEAQYIWIDRWIVRRQPEHYASRNIGVDGLRFDNVKSWEKIFTRV